MRASNQVYGDRCPIWPEYPGKGYLADAFEIRQEWSPRAGGPYEITREAELSVSTLSEIQRARLTTILVDQRKNGVESPRVELDLLNEAEKREPLQAGEQSERLLKYLADNTSVGGIIKINGPLPPEDAKLSKAQIAGCEAMAWSESTTLEQVRYFLEDLVKNGLIDQPAPTSCRVTVDGRRHITNREEKIVSMQAFIAMWMDPCMSEIHQEAIEPAIREAGYEPFRVGDEYHLDAIEEKALSEIRRSKFVVVDLTHGPKGARGSVYFEAGFARALDKPIIYTCRKDQAEDVHFDVDHFLRIEWETSEELRKGLLKAIEDVVG